MEWFQVALFCYREVGNRNGEGSTLNNIGAVYYDRGRYTEALDAYWQAFAIAQEIDYPVAEGSALNAIGGVYYDQGDYAEALNVFEQALTIWREIGDLEGEGATLNNIGLVHAGQGRYAEALEAYQQALAITREVGDQTGEGVTLNNIGLVHRAQGRYAEALEAYQQSLAILRGLDNLASEGTTLNNIGAVYDDQGRYAEALDYYQQALVIARAVGDRPGKEVTLNNIGLVYHIQGRYAEAMESFQQALAIGREVGDRVSEGRTLNNIGSVFHAQGRYDEALDYYQQAWAIVKQVGDLAHEGTMLNNIGGVYHDLERDTEALAAYQQALAIRREIGDRSGEAVTLNNIGIIYNDQQQYAKALASYQEALAIRQEVGNRTGEGTTLGNIGKVYYDQGRYDEALTSYQQALAIAREVGDWPGIGITLDNMGQAYEEQRDADRALTHYEQAMDAFESLRAIAGSEAGRAGFIAQYAGIYDRTVSLYHQYSQDEAAFHTSERGRSRAFLDSLATGYVELSDQAAADLLAREQGAYAGRLAAQDALARAWAQKPTDATLIADLEAQLVTVEAEHAAALAAIEARDDQLRSLVPGRSAVLDLAEVQTLLDEQITLLSYHVLGDEGALAFVITRDDWLVVELPEATPENLRTALADLHQWLNLENPHPPPLRNLHTWLVAPLVGYLRTPLVGIIPHHQLHYIPFAALADGEIYFGQQHTLFTLPSASTLPFIQENASNACGTTAFVLGNPETDNPELAPLAHASAEAQAIANLLNTQAYMGAEASEAQVRTGVEDAEVVHLAAHGSFNTTAPLYSAIYLASADEDDGRLEAYEIYGLDLKATDLVVLSACETNIGELSAGDELVGLTRAFFFAGAPTVVASLWSVDDAATQELMVAFYRHWQAGMGKAEALQAAQAEVRESHPSPYYWAAFVLSGDPGVVTREISSALEGTVIPAGTQTLEAESKGSRGICGTVGLVVPLLLLGVHASRRRWRSR